MCPFKKKSKQNKINKNYHYSQKDYELISRLDAIPCWPWKKSALVVVGFGFFFAFFDIITIALSLKVIQQQFDITESTSNWAITSSLIGYIVGSFLIARLSDLFSRKMALFLSVSLFTVGSILTAFSWYFWMILLFRFISGMGIGAEISEVSTYLSEMSPRHGRGRYTSIAIGCGFLGFAVVPFIAALIVPSFNWGWRLLFLIGGLGGLAISIMRRNIPYSPRHLLALGKYKQAKKLIEEAEVRAKRKCGDGFLKHKVNLCKTKETNVFSLFTFLQKPNLFRLFLFSFIWFFYYIGNYAWLGLLDELLINHGYSVGKSMWINGATSLGFILGAILAICLGDKIERKWSCLFLVLIWSVLLLIVCFYHVQWSIIIIGFLASTTIAYIIPIMYTYTAEVFRTDIRATGVALTDGVGHIGAALCPQIVLGISNLFSKNLQFGAAIFVMAITGFITFVLLFFGPRTNRINS